MDDFFADDEKKWKNAVLLFMTSIMKHSAYLKKKLDLKMKISVIKRESQCAYFGNENYPKKETSQTNLNTALSK